MSEASGRLVRGDEGELFERYHRRLLRATAMEIKTSRDNVDEACAFAWAELMSHEVRRETAFAWLKQVARREAMRLKRLDHSSVPFAREPGAVDRSAFPFRPATRPSHRSAGRQRSRVFMGSQGAIGAP